MDIILIIKTLLILFLGVISPGPDFFIVLKNSLTFGRRAGLFSALGIATGCLISFTVLICGLKFLFAYKFTQLILSLSCGFYLIYLGFLSIKSKSHRYRINYEHTAIDMKMPIYYKNGLFTNVFNPKLYTICGAILTYTEQQHPSLGTNIGIIIGNAIMVFAWFSMAALMLSHPKIQISYFNHEIFINRILGFVLILVGSRIIFS